MIVCFECKRAALKVVSIVLFLIYLLCTWVTCLPVHSRCTGAFMCLCEVTFNDCLFRVQASCFDSCEYCFVSNLSVVYLGDLFTCTQQMHWGIYKCMCLCEVTF